jgi:hypothetical protein
LYKKADSLISLNEIKDGLILSDLFYETGGGSHEGSSKELALMVAKL